MAVGVAGRLGVWIGASGVAGELGEGLVELSPVVLGVTVVLAAAVVGLVSVLWEPECGTHAVVVG